MTTPPGYADSAIDDELRARFHRAIAVGRNSDWSDVATRSRRVRGGRSFIPRPRLVLAAAVAAVAVAAPAVAIVGGLIDFSSAPSAPESVRVEFGKLDAVNPMNGPGAVTGETRDVYTFKTASGSFDLLVAPARDGWCYAVSGLGGFGPACPTTAGPMDVGHYESPTAGEPDLIEGSVRDCSVQRIVMKFEDGTTTDLPFVSVSTPINADFFLYEVDSAHQSAGKRPSTVTAYGNDGNVVGSGWLINEADAPAPTSAC